MRKFTFVLSLLFAITMTAMAQSYSLTETRLSSAELNAKTASTYIAIKNLSATNNYYFVGNTGAAPYSAADYTEAAVFVWEPVNEGVAGSYYLKKLDGTYMQTSSPKDFGTKENAAVFTTTNPTQAGEGSANFNGDGDSQAYIDTQDMLVRFVNNAGTWINVQNGAAGTPVYNVGKGGWTIHYVYAVDANEPTPEFEEAKAALKAATDKAKALLDEAQLTIEKDPITLQTTDASAAGYLWSNAPDPDEGSIDYLVDGIVGVNDNFFHSNWHNDGGSSDGLAHYLLVDLGEGVSIKDFVFNYHTRTGAANDYPVDILIEGSNDKEYFEEITKVEGLTARNNQSYTSPVFVSNGEYRYLRFMVTKTTNDRKAQGNDHDYWHMAEFGLSNVAKSVATGFEDVIDEIVALDAEYKRVMANAAMNAEQMNAATATLSALNATIDAGFKYEAIALSTDENKIYYKIGSYNRGGFLSTVGDNKSVQHIFETPASYWYFTKADENGGVYIQNLTSKQYLGADRKMSDTPAVWYILPNGINHNGFVISSTNPISSGSCIDANSYDTGVGSWAPSAGDWEGTTWVFTKLEPTVTSLNKLDSNKKYIIESQRAFLMYSDELPDNLASSTGKSVGTVTKDPENSNQQFKIEKDGANYYLYSVGAGKYVNKTGAYVDTKVDALTFSYVGGEYNWQLGIGGNGLNSQAPNQTDEGVIVNGWTYTDAGNCYKIIDATFAAIAEFIELTDDLNEAIAVANESISTNEFTTELLDSINTTIDAANEAYHGVITPNATSNATLKNLIKIINETVKYAEFTTAEDAALKAIAKAKTILASSEKINVIALQTTEADKAGYIWCNDPEQSEGPIEDLIDGDPSTFFHTNWHNSQEDIHWIETDLGNGNKVQNFAFNYHTRVFNGESDFPDAITVLGSNNSVDYDTIAKIDSDLPQTANTSWTSSVISATKEYRYLRFAVTAENIYWHMAEFNLLGISKENEEYNGVISALVTMGFASKVETANLTTEQLKALAATLNESINAVMSEIVVLKDTDESYTQDVDIVNVPWITYKRTFEHSEWQALYVPFAIDVEYLKNELGITVARIRELSQTDEGHLHLKVQTVDNGKTTANYPYLIKLGSAGEKVIKVQNTTLKAAASKVLTCSTMDYGATFVGTYEPVTDMFENGYFGMSNGRLKQASGTGVTLSAFRWYLELEDRTGSININEIKLRINSEETTGIESTETIDLSAPVYYDLSGRKVENPTTGIYIVNGKKVMVK